MAQLIDCPDALAVRRTGSAGLASEYLVAALEVWHGIMVHAYGGDPSGRLIVNSLYRPKSDLAPGGPGPRDGVTVRDYEIDFSDANGHWRGRSVDYSTCATAESFWGPGCEKPLWNTVKDAMFEAGIFHPWYWRYRNGQQSRHEFWHAAVEATPWKQSRAFRGKVPHYYG